MTQQIETATVIGTITLGGNASVIVTSAGMTNSPKSNSVAVLLGDNASAVALKIRQVLALDADVQAFFLVGGSAATVVLTARTDTSNDTTLNIAIDNDTCTGLTAAPTSANTQAGAVVITNGYATLADYKSWIAMRGQAGSVTTDATDDNVIAVLIEAASRYIDRETGKRFFADSSDATRYYQTDESECVDIDPLSTAPTSVSVDYTAGLRSYTELTTTQYDLTPVNALLEGNPYTAIEINPVFAAYFPHSRNGVKVVGKFGYPSVPKDIQEAVLSIAQNLNSTRSGQQTGGQVNITAAGIVIRPSDVPSFAQKIIEHYRRRV